MKSISLKIVACLLLLFSLNGTKPGTLRGIARETEKPSFSQLPLGAEVLEKQLAKCEKKLGTPKADSKKLKCIIFYCAMKSSFIDKEADKGKKNYCMLKAYSENGKNRILDFYSFKLPVVMILCRPAVTVKPSGENAAMLCSNCAENAKFYKPGLSSLHGKGHRVKAGTAKQNNAISGLELV